MPLSIVVLYLFDWVLITLSFFNTMATFWLGLTVLLNAERRNWGTWLAAGGLLFAAAFFVIHTALMSRALWEITDELAFWWPLVWVPFIGAPYLWYLVMAWFSGTITQPLQRVMVVVVGLLGVSAAGLLLVANPFPSFGEVLSRQPRPVISLWGVPVALLVYPVYALLCVLLSLLALRRPAQSDRFMGDLGRERARPWLMAASLILLLVGLVTGGVFAWLLERVRTGDVPQLGVSSLLMVIIADITISGLIAVVVILLGKAIVSYEVFTGKTLPRGGLARYWRNSLILSVGFGALVGGSLNLPIPPVYQVLIATLFVTLFYALLGWRTFVERDRSTEQLRPFVASQGLYDRLLRPLAPQEVDLAGPFRALCDDLLNAQLAYLLPLGPLAPLAGQPLRFHANHLPFPPDLQFIPTPDVSPTQLYLRLDPQHYAGAHWAVPLWSERGLAGVLLLGEKRDQRLYTQEEIELARAVGERLLDTQAAAELARRLVSLQRRRLAESQVLDRRARRVLHDDVLPRLHTAMLTLASQPVSPGSPSAIDQLTEVHQQISRLLRELPPTAEPELAKLGLVGALRQVVESELRGAFDQVRWEVTATDEQRSRELSSLNAEVLFFAAREGLRNAARYARVTTPARPLYLTVRLEIDAQATLRLVIEDDGIGFTTPSRSSGGSGQGLALHTTLLAVIGGTLTLQTPAEAGTRLIIALPREAW